MATLNEATGGLSQTPSDVEAMRLISLDQTITFSQYIRYVLPLDGYVFWLRTRSTQVRGSLHNTQSKRQNEDETLAVNRFTFSTGFNVQEFNDVSPTKIWVGEYQGLKFAFTVNGSVYEAAGLYHYTGEAVYPAMLSQLIDNGEQLPVTTLIVSNSLPLWLQLADYVEPWLIPANPGITLFPSFAVPANLPPPYGTVHIDPNGMKALQPTPLLGPVWPVGSQVLGEPMGSTDDSTHWQLVSDHVRVTLYGATNAAAMDFVDLVNQYSRDLDTMGIMTATPMRDEKRTQAELGILAMKKTIEFDVSYYQSRVNNVARQLINSASATFVDNPLY